MGLSVRDYGKGQFTWGAGEKKGPYETGLKGGKFSPRDQGESSMSLALSLTNRIVSAFMQKNTNEHALVKEYAFEVQSCAHSRVS